MGKPAFLEGTLYSTCSKAGFKMYTPYVTACSETLLLNFLTAIQPVILCAVRSGPIMLCGFRTEEQLTQDLIYFAHSVPVEVNH